MSSSVGSPTAVPCARTVRHLSGAVAFSASAVGVCATWTALNSSLFLFSPQPSRIRSRTGPSALERFGCACRVNFSSAGACEAMFWDVAGRRRVIAVGGDGLIKSSLFLIIGPIIIVR